RIIQPRERVWQLPMSANPLMVDKIAMLKDSMPERLFNSEVLGLWPDEDEKPFRSTDVDKLFIGGGKIPVGPFKTAIDVARFKNWTFATRWAPGPILDDGTQGKPQMVAAMGLRNMRTHQQLLRLEQFCRQGPGEVIVDCTGAHGATFREGLEQRL